jgi:hypothetical protein
MPSDATMNENSPICARPCPSGPPCVVPLPVRKTPTAHADDLAGDDDEGEEHHRPPVARHQRRVDEHAHRDEEDAAKMSRTGCTRCSTRVPRRTSAMSEPAMNAPSATE